MLGLCETVITSAAVAISADTGGFLTITALTDGTLTGVVSKYTRAGVTVDANAILKAGTTIYSIAQATISTGTYQIIFHKS